MNFGFTEEQELLRAEVRKFLDANAPLETVRGIVESPEGFSRDLWKQIAELGWVGLLVPEAHGGAGLGWVDLVVVLEETGRSLFPSPLLSHTLAVDALRHAGSESQQAAWLPRLADGSAVATVALLEEDDLPGADGVRLPGEASDEGFVLRGEKLFVPDAGAADLFVVAFRADGGVRLALVERSADGVSAEDWPGIDLTRRVGRLRLDGVRVGADAVLARGDEAALQRVLDAGATAVAVESVGAAEAALRLTVDYAKQRVQFGRPIGQFQGVKHPLAEMFVDVESWKSLAYYAAWCLDERHPDTSLAASRAKAYASEAFPRLGIDVVQLHGGIGYTWEYDAHLFLKRAKWMRPAFGDADWHDARIARLTGL
ncbi:MAG: acyl-CoA dehydrogenase family protein [Myxococcota bacterium]|nr:acyl-CoA dehydrogenase family protein [Myxococcota bacterium]